MNPTTLHAFDALLLFSIVCLAWASLSSPDERRGVILFMTFGLLLAVAWSRLQAPDVALAEAANRSVAEGRAIKVAEIA